ncbi:hypothetical protein BDY19DRAFT_121663 [Irpex rosettiformis]|uniref:Uncharacterized protein n=1 Tax=Irpex rosettiformis TaxID=378272 RepID=A0ACB8U3T7_9APHY|nr:hypothetical protein BDY19DRAFT_121663 [Irpex rosettiformis]
MADNDNPSGNVVELTDSADFEDEAPAGIVTDTFSDQSSRDTIQDVPRSSMYRDTDSDASSDDDYFHDAVAGSEAEHVGGDNVQASEEMAQDTVTSVDESVAHPGESPSELVDAINGMYRILDLVGEEGSGGFIDKIVIAQESFGRFANSIYPGAYTSMTKINFAALDHMDVRPIGLYGSKSELVRYLIEVGVVDDEIAQKLLKASNEGETSLRSGMYLVNAPSTDLIYALYWPEETTWNDNASASVVVCFLSDEHAETLVWEDESESAVNELDDEMDRLFAFRVSKTNEKEENVVARDGFLVFRSGISCPAFHQNMPIDPQLLMPRLVLGETVSGFMTASYRPTRKSSAEKQDKYQLVFLRSQIQAGKIRIGDVDEDSLNILISAGLASRVPDAFDRFRRARAAFDEEIAMRKLEEGKRLAEQQKSLLPRLMLGVKYARAKAVLRVFKSFDISLVLKEAMEEDMDALVDLLKATYPGYGEFYDSPTRTAVTEKIPRPTFHTLKAKLLLLYDCFSSRPSLTPKERLRLSELSYGELLERQSAPESSSKGGFRAVFSLVSGAAAYIVIGSTQKSSPKETTPSKTSEDSDAVFLEKLARMVDTFPELANTAVEAREIAEDFIKTRIEEKTAAIASSFQEPEKKQLETHLRLEQARREQEVFQRTRHDLITAFNSQLVGHSTNYIEVTSLRPSRSSKDTFSIEGREKRIQPAAIEYAVEVLQLTEDDRVAMWQDDRHVPRPKLSSGRGSTIMFELPVTHRLRHIQLLPNKICLLVIFLTRLTVGGTRRRSIKTKWGLNFSLRSTRRNTCWLFLQRKRCKFMSS